MARQRKLFITEDRKEQEKQRKQKVLELFKEKQRKEREINREKEKLRKINRRPKTEFYQCECGIKLYWRVAYGHRSGCPQCHKPIPLSKIFETT
ncbi:MAG: hypothetical protein ACTSRS_01520 [Candidatus Helarchaeota archaeon]